MPFLRMFFHSAFIGLQSLPSFVNENEFSSNSTLVPFDCTLFTASSSFLIFEFDRETFDLWTSMHTKLWCPSAPEQRYTRFIWLLFYLFGTFWPSAFAARWPTCCLNRQRWGRLFRPQFAIWHEWIFIGGLVYRTSNNNNRTILWLWLCFSII